MNRTEPVITIDNGKSAQKMHRLEGGKHAKTHLDYWKSRVTKPSGSKLYSVQIAHRGSRHRFPLETAEKAVAAERAKERYLFLVANGWEATMQRFKPKVAPIVKPEKVATVGELITAVESTVAYRPLTLAAYKRALRQITAAIAGIGDQVEMDDHGKPRKDRRGRIKYLSRRHGAGNALWVASVDRVSLTMLSREAIQAWRIAYVEAAGKSLEARRRAEISASSLLRNARSLFTEKALEFVQLKLPEPLPFSGKLKLKKPTSSFKARLNIPRIIREAQKELEQECLKIFTLALLAGLRKGEIDKLEWRAVDLRMGRIDLGETEFFQAKSEDSRGEIDLDPELVEQLSEWYQLASGAFVVESDQAPCHHGASASYRCEAHFQNLYSWLRRKGVSAHKPLHELRKELGAHLANEQGIFAAKAVLRHAQISTTTAYYVDKKRKITGGLGTFLAAIEQSKSAPVLDFHPESAQHLADKAG